MSRLEGQRKTMSRAAFSCSSRSAPGCLKQQLIMVNIEIRAHKQASVIVSRALNVLCELAQGHQATLRERSMAMDLRTLPHQQRAPGQVATLLSPVGMQ